MEHARRLPKSSLLRKVAVLGFVRDDTLRAARMDDDPAIPVNPRVTQSHSPTGEWSAQIIH